MCAAGVFHSKCHKRLRPPLPFKRIGIGKYKKVDFQSDLMIENELLESEADKTISVTKQLGRFLKAR